MQKQKNKNVHKNLICAYKEILYEKIVKINISDENKKNKSVAKCVKCTRKIQD